MILHSGDFVEHRDELFFCTRAIGLADVVSANGAIFAAREKKRFCLGMVMVKTRDLPCGHKNVVLGWVACDSTYAVLYPKKKCKKIVHFPI
jgi:hypothetical protein